MEKIEREDPLDFMNVESFSQLPFIRPIIKEKPIRLFGKEFGGGGGGDSTTNTMTTTNMSESINSDPFRDEPETNTGNCTTDKESRISKNDEIRRTYECHYCFRNFPTSQALGGHQNAHKKERQSAKRPHLHSSIVHGTNIYGITNRRGLDEATRRSRHHHHSTWTTNIISTPHPNRFYGNGYNVNVISPINGSPLAFWQIPPPATHQNNSSSSCSNLVFPNDDLIRTSQMVKISSNCESQFGFEPNGEVQDDHVNLDLHL